MEDNEKKLTGSDIGLDHYLPPQYINPEIKLGSGINIPSIPGKMKSKSITELLEEEEKGGKNKGIGKKIRGKDNRLIAQKKIVKLK